jgi:hypothetical protein
MRRNSYFSRIARVGVKSEPSLAPRRVLFRPPPPIPDGLGAEPRAISSAEGTLVESRSGGHFPELAPNATAPSEELVPSRDIRAPVAPKLPLAPVGRPPVAESSSAVTPGGEMRLLPQVSGPVLVPRSPLSSSTKPVPDATTNVGLQLEATRDQARPARPDRQPKAPTRSTTTPSAAPVSERASKTGPKLLIPPLALLEPFAQAPAGAKKREAVSADTGGGVRIGALEVRIVSPPVAVAVPRSLSQAFRLFGLTQG